MPCEIDNDFSISGINFLKIFLNSEAHFFSLVNGIAREVILWSNISFIETLFMVLEKPPRKDSFCNLSLCTKLYSILNIATTYAHTGSGYVVPSAAAKGGVVSLTKSIAAEWAKYKIRCNAVAPGPFPTKGAWDRLVPPGFSKFIDIKKRIPLKRLGEHQELSNIVAYLLSDYSSYITGEVMTIDGGEWIYNAGQFSWLDKIPKAMWTIIEKTIRKKNK